MYIKCWGSRGSIPVSGREYERYGGDTTCIEIRTKDDRTLIVDAGTGIRRLGKQLMKEGRYSCHMIFTHAHWDHLMGFPFFRPLYSEKTRIQIEGCPFAQKYVEVMLSKVMSPPSFPVRLKDIKAEISYEPACPDRFQIGTTTVIPVRLSHPNGGSGYKFIEDGKVFVFITDNELDFTHEGGLSFEAYRDFSAGADLLIHDAEFTAEDYMLTREWGHSLYTSALQLAIEAKVKAFGLFHLNQDRTDKEVDDMVDRCRKIISDQHADLKCFAVGFDTTFNL